MISQGSNDVVNPVSPLYFDKPLLAGSGYQLRINVDSSMSASSINPVQNKIVKSYVDNAIANLPEEQFLDLTKTEFVENFNMAVLDKEGQYNLSGEHQSEPGRKASPGACVKRRGRKRSIQFY